MRYCSTWLRSLLCYIKNFEIEEFVIRVLHCRYIGNTPVPVSAQYSGLEDLEVTIS